MTYGTEDLIIYQKNTLWQKEDGSDWMEKMDEEKESILEKEK